MSSRRTTLRAALRARLLTITTGNGYSVDVSDVLFGRLYPSHFRSCLLSIAADDETIDDRTLNARNGTIQFSVLGLVRVGSATQRQDATEELDELVDAVDACVKADRTLGVDSTVDAAVTRIETRRDLAADGTCEANVTVTVRHRR